MSDRIRTTGSREAAQAVGRCFGALFFSVFGGLWLVLAAYAAARLDLLSAALIAGCVIVFCTVAVRLQRRGRQRAHDGVPDELKRQNDRILGIVNAIQGVAIFLVMLLLPQTPYGQFAIPVVALIVGLHFFALPPLYRHKANLVTGALIVGWTIFCVVVWREDIMVACTAFGVGVILWCSAAWALRTAANLLTVRSTNLRQASRNSPDG